MDLAGPDPSTGTTAASIRAARTTSLQLEWPAGLPVPMGDSHGWGFWFLGLWIPL
jgi:hypothetical protein